MSFIKPTKRDIEKISKMILDSICIKLKEILHVDRNLILISFFLFIFPTNANIQGDTVKNMITLIGVPLWCNFKQSLYVHHPCEIYHYWLKNVNISMAVSIKKAEHILQNHQRNIPIMCWQGWWTGGNFKIISCRNSHSNVNLNFFKLCIIK